MYALVLCGGFARRLYPIGDFIPKALLTLNGIPLVDYIVDKLIKNNVDKIYISTNARFKNQFKYWLDLHKYAGMKAKVDLIVEPSTDESNKFGAVKGIAYDIEKGKINDDLLIIAGDNFFTFSLTPFIKTAKKLRNPAIISYDIGDKERAKNFGVIIEENNFIKQLEEKPQVPRSTLISTGIYYLPKEYLNKVGEYVKETSKGDNIGELISWLAQKTKVHVYKPKKGEWFDIGTIDSYRELFHNHNGKHIMVSIIKNKNKRSKINHKKVGKNDGKNT